MKLPTSDPVAASERKTWLLVALPRLLKSAIAQPSSRAIAFNSRLPFNTTGRPAVSSSSMSSVLSL